MLRTVYQMQRFTVVFDFLFFLHIIFFKLSRGQSVRRDYRVERGCLARYNERFTSLPAETGPDCGFGNF